ncbi:ATP-binding protein [Niallia sp. RD1]|uniref:ATP-binding protein n=1 Tax=Niallia sp. RD1 TaxID=2962858 RepID=UPI0020C19AE2|nr:ATP-binding protein [Niallia sp. RD1]UTI40320.1 ATP-binding protein [Niallia sp. RD1]
MIRFDNYLFLLLLNVVPIFIYYYYFHKMKTKNTVLFTSVYCSIILILAMSFPLEIAPGHIYDLRTIPWLVAFLYGGFPAGLLTTIVMAIYRYMIGYNEGLIVMLIIVLLTLPILYVAIKKYKQAESYGKKIMIACLISLVPISIDLIATSFFTNKLTWTFVIYLYLSHIVTLSIAVYLIESLSYQERKKEQMQQTERIRLIGEMAASVAHEIRNPLTVVKGYTHLLKEASNITEKQKDMLLLMSSELVRAEKIINDYLSLARTNEGTKEQINLGKLIKKVEELMSPYALLNNVKIYNQVQTECIIEAGQDEILQVFINIIKNAIEAIEGKGEVIVSEKTTENYVKINIADNGKGMTEEELNRLGTPFYSTKTQGTGIGTMVCFNIVHHLNGKIEMKSKMNKGTTCSVYLPILSK